MKMVVLYFGNLRLIIMILVLVFISNGVNQKRITLAFMSVIRAMMKKKTKMVIILYAYLNHILYEFGF